MVTLRLFRQDEWEEAMQVEYAGYLIEPSSLPEPATGLGRVGVCWSHNGGQVWMLYLGNETYDLPESADSAALALARQRIALAVRAASAYPASSVALAPILPSSSADRPSALRAGVSPAAAPALARAAPARR